MAQKLLFKCEDCGTKQPVSPKAHRSHTCVDCGKTYALVNDGEGNKALVPFFNQEKKNQ